MKPQAIVTLADSNYFDLLIELISSIKRFEQSKNISICVLDAGLKGDQIQNLNNKVEIIKKANWDIEVPKFKVLGKEWLKSQVSRAFLPDYFPDFEKYLWIDCDAWVNTWECVDLYFKACENGKIGITQTIGAGYKVLTKVKWILGRLAAIKSQNYKHAKKSGFSETIARKIAFAPHLNIGVFSLEKDSECWKIWQENLKKTLKTGSIFGSEGLAMNISVYVDDVKAEFLPLLCNWIASNVLPKYDQKSKSFVEPYLPNQKIGIMHLAAGIWNDNRDMRVNKDIKIPIETTQGNKILKSLRYGIV
jgi:hypothetical protein